MFTEFSELQNGHRPLQLKGDLIFTSLFFVCECFGKLEFRNDFSLYILPFTGSVNNYKSEEKKLYFLRYISECNETSAVKLEPFDELSY